jgi:hypothetical protein
MIPTHFQKRGHGLPLVVLAALAFAGSASAQTDLSAYANENGHLDVQRLTCGQLASTFQEDADLLTAWYSGWYNGLARKHFANLPRGKLVEHEVIVYCKQHPEKRVIEALRSYSAMSASRPAST